MLVYVVFQFYPRFDFIFLSVFGFETKRKKTEPVRKGV